MIKNIVERAKQFALEKHAGQMYGDKPYSYHLQGVVDNIAEYIESSNRVTKKEAICVAWLHDILEDTNTTEEEICSNFGNIVTFGVTSLTNNFDCYCDYIKNIKTMNCEEIILIKIADLKFNIKEAENRELTAYEKQRLEKYKLALYILEH